MFRGGPLHHGVYGPEVAGVTGVDLPLKWRFKTGDKIRSTPAVAEGTVFVGSCDGHLYAVAADSGQLQWKYATGGDVSSSPAVVDGTVVFFGGDRTLYALDAGTGAVKWKLATEAALKFEFTPGDPRIFDYYAPSPTVSSGRVFCGSYDGRLYVVDLATGKPVWSFDTKAWVHGAPAVSDGVVFVGNYDGECFALDEATGAMRWKYTVERDATFPVPVTLVGSPAVADGLVYFTSNVPTFVVALDAVTGELRWRTEHPGSMIYSSPAVANGLVIVGGSDAQMVQALDAKTGAEKWRHNTRARVLPSIMVADGLAYFGNTEAYFQVVTLHDGKQVVQTYTEASVHSSSVLHDGVLYVGSDDDHLYAFERRLQLAKASTASTGQ